MKIYEVNYVNLHNNKKQWFGNVKEYPIGYYRSIRKVRRAIKKFAENSEFLSMELINSECKKLKRNDYYQSIAHHSTETAWGCIRVIIIEVE